MSNTFTTPNNKTRRTPVSTLTKGRRTPLSTPNKSKVKRSKSDLALSKDQCTIPDLFKKFKNNNESNDGIRNGKKLEKEKASTGEEEVEWDKVSLYEDEDIDEIERLEGWEEIGNNERINRDKFKGCYRITEYKKSLNILEAINLRKHIGFDNSLYKLHHKIDLKGSCKLFVHLFIFILY